MLYRWVGHRVDALQLRDAHFGVYLRGREVGVGEHLLDKADVGSVFQHEGGATVPEQVAAAMSDAGAADVLADEPGEVIGAHGAVAVAA